MVNSTLRCVCLCFGIMMAQGHLMGSRTLAECMGCRPKVRGRWPGEPRKPSSGLMCFECREELGQSVRPNGAGGLAVAFGRGLGGVLLSVGRCVSTLQWGMCMQCQLQCGSLLGGWKNGGRSPTVSSLHWLLLVPSCTPGRGHVCACERELSPTLAGSVGGASGTPWASVGRLEDEGAGPGAGVHLGCVPVVQGAGWWGRAVCVLGPP